MENRQPPPASESLGGAFYILLLVPIASMAMTVSFFRIGGVAADLGILLLVFTLLAMPFCSVLGATLVGMRSRTSLGVLTLAGVQIVYVGVAALGCVVLFQVPIHALWSFISLS
jgi:hypothetical protein